MAIPLLRNSGVFSLAIICTARWVFLLSMFNLGYTGHRTTKGLDFFFVGSWGSLFLIIFCFSGSFHYLPFFVLGSFGFLFLHGAAYKEDW